jgi:hypothetical protein
MKFYFDGCSFTEAKAYLRDYDTQRFSGKVCRHFGAEEYNFSRSGASNLRILRNISVDNYNFLDECDLVVIQMSFRNRTEWYSDERQEWMRVNPVYVGNPKKDKEECQIREGFWHDYYMEVYSETQAYAYERMVYNNIKSICKSKSVPLVFLSVPNPNIDIDYDFVIKGYPTEFPNGGGHINSLGHNLLAKDIINHIKHENLL